MKALISALIIMTSICSFAQDIRFNILRENAANMLFLQYYLQEVKLISKADLIKSNNLHKEDANLNKKIGTGSILGGAAVAYLGLKIGMKHSVQIINKRLSSGNINKTRPSLAYTGSGLTIIGGMAASYGVYASSSLSDSDDQHMNKMEIEELLNQNESQVHHIVKYVVDMMNLDGNQEEQLSKSLHAQIAEQIINGNDQLSISISKVLKENHIVSNEEATAFENLHRDLSTLDIDKLSKEDAEAIIQTEFAIIKSTRDITQKIIDEQRADIDTELELMAYVERLNEIIFLYEYAENP